MHSRSKGPRPPTHEFAYTHAQQIDDQSYLLSCDPSTRLSDENIHHYYYYISDDVSDYYYRDDGGADQHFTHHQNTCDAYTATSGIADCPDYHPHDRGILRGRRHFQRMDPQIISGTLGCPDIWMEIMSFVPDEDFVKTMINYLIISKKLTSGFMSQCCLILKERKILICKSMNEMKFLLAFHNLSENFKTELVIDGLMGKDWKLKYLSFIEKFPIVHLSRVSLTRKNLLELLSFTTSKIEHLKFTSCPPLEGTLPSTRVYHVTPHLKKLTFKDQNTNPISEIGDVRFDPKEMIFLSYLNVLDHKLIRDKYSSLVKLALLHPDIPFSMRTHLALNLDELCLDILPLSNCLSKTLNIARATNNVPSIDCQNVERIILRGNGSSKEYRREISSRETYEDSISIGLKDFLGKLLVSYPKCEELVLSETFADALKLEDIEQGEITSFLKRIIIKYSKNTQASIYGSLKFGLQFIFPKTLIILEEISDERYQEPHEKFEIHTSSNRILKQDCFEDEIFRKIEKLEKDFKVMDNEMIKDKLGGMKHLFCTSITSKNFSKLTLIQDSLNILEGLKRNKELMLENINQAIENYLDLFGVDDLYLKALDKFDSAMCILESEYEDPKAFSREYNELEALFHIMIQVVEESGYPSKVLFNEQWFNEQIVEMYNINFNERDIQFYEDSEHDMELACNELEDDELEDDDEIVL